MTAARADGQKIHAADAHAAQDMRAGIERRSGGIDVIHEERAARDPRLSSALGG